MKIDSRYTLLAAALITLLSAATNSLAQNSPIVADGAELRQLPGTYGFTEGPIADSQGNVYFTDQPNNRIVKWNAADNTVEDWLKPAGRSNGMYFDPNGNLITAADGANELWSIAPDKSHTVILKDLDGKRFNGPNDLWINPDGSGLYFTDPLYPRDWWTGRSNESQLTGRNVYYLAKGATTPTPVVTDFQQPNGIVGTPDGKTLYISDINARQTFRYDIQPDGSLTNKKLHCSAGSDGMTLDNQGNLYITNRQGVTVFNPAGEQIQNIPVPQGWTANVTFGGTNHDQLFITASTAIYAIQTKVKAAGH